jgi:hypothetical protein
LNPRRKEAWCTVEEALEKRAGVLIRIWIHRTRPLAGTAATGQGGRELGAGVGPAEQLILRATT